MATKSSVVCPASVSCCAGKCGGESVTASYTAKQVSVSPCSYLLAQGWIRPAVRGGVGHPAAGDVDDERPVRQRGQEAGVDEVLGVRGERHAHDHHLAARQQPGQVGDPVHALASGPRDPHQVDQFVAWRSGELIAITTDWDTLRKENT